MKMLLSSLFDFNSWPFQRDDWICGLVHRFYDRETHARNTHTHILNDEKNHVKYHQMPIVLICYCQFEPPIAT